MVVQTRVGKRGTVVVPAILRRRLHMEEGAILSVEEREGGVLLKALPMGPTAEERRRFFAEFTAQVATTRADPRAWAEEEEERAALAGTLLDGLDESDEIVRG